MRLDEYGYSVTSSITGKRCKLRMDVLLGRIGQDREYPITLIFYHGGGQIGIDASGFHLWGEEFQVFDGHNGQTILVTDDPKEAIFEAMRISKKRSLEE